MKILRSILILLIIAGIAVLAYWYVNKRPTTPASTALTGSGTVETTEVTISPEVSGRIITVTVSQGDVVKAGDILFKLDTTLLNAQRSQAEANLSAAQAALQTANDAVAAAQAMVTTAQAQYDLAVANARLQAQPSQAAAWNQPEPQEFNQPVWYFTQAEEITATLKEVSAASGALDKARFDLDSKLTSGSYAMLASVESRLAQARAAFLNASSVLDRANSQNDITLRDAAQQAYDSAKAELDAAQKAYDEQLTTEEAQTILVARANLAAAQARYDEAIGRYNGLLSGPNSLAVKVASDSVAQAQANVTAAQAQANQAQQSIRQAQAALNLVDVQQGKLVISAPVDGVVLARNVEPGEVVLPGATALTIGQLEHLTITVYLPESQYGKVKLGDKASVSVDSFPSALYFATVTRIADQAEFTPRNVQTAEGRQTTVYAVELSVDNPAGLLKPGMPADVSFLMP